MRHLGHNVGGIDSIGPTKRRRRLLVVGEQHHANQQKKGELEKDSDSAHKQSRDRLSLVARREKPLHDQLVSAMGGRSQKSSSEQARPKCVWPPEIRGEVKDAPFPGRRGSLVN